MTAGARIWLRWATVHGLPRALLTSRARRGEPMARLLLGRADRRERERLIEDIRATGRLVRTPAVWVSADHEVCRTILRDNNFGVSSSDEAGLPEPVSRLADRMDPGLPNPVQVPSMLMTNPPEHTEYRRLVARSFTPKSIANLETRISDLTAELLDELSRRDTVDLVDDYAAQLPAAVITEILGLPASDRQKVLLWGNSAAPLLDIGLKWRTFRPAIRTLGDIDTYLTEHFRRLHSTGDDGTPFSAMALEGGLTDRELKTNAALLVGAGVETTVNLISNGIAVLLENPDQLALLRQDPELWPSAVEEILRFASPVQMTARTAHCDTDIVGTRIRQGEVVALLLGGANRDPEVFAQPGRFDITRPNSREHLAFATGIHVCLGAPLARIEGATALRELFDHFPELHLSGPAEPRELVNLYGYRHLPARLSPEPAARPRVPADG